MALNALNSAERSSSRQRSGVQVPSEALFLFCRGVAAGTPPPDGGLEEQDLRFKFIRIHFVVGLSVTKPHRVAGSKNKTFGGLKEQDLWRGSKNKTFGKKKII